MKIAIINNSVYRITERDFKRILVVIMTDTTKGREKHDRKCEYIINKYTPILEADLMLRND